MPETIQLQSIHFDSKITAALKLVPEFETHAGVERLDLLAVHYEDSKEKKDLLGYCTLKRFEQPFKFYYVSWVIRSYRLNLEEKIKFGLKSPTGQANEKTIGDLIIERVNAFLDAKKLPGFLLNSINSEQSGTYDLFYRNGWKMLDDRLCGYGGTLPENILKDKDGKFKRDEINKVRTAIKSGEKSRLV